MRARGDAVTAFRPRPSGRPYGDGLHYATASGTGGRKAAITRIWDMAGSTLKKPIRGRRMGVGAVTPIEMGSNPRESWSNNGWNLGK